MRPLGIQDKQTGNTQIGDTLKFQSMWQNFLAWWWSIAPYLRTPVPVVISLIALYFSLHDRRPHLIVRARKGDWAKLAVTQTGKNVLFMGIVEIYNTSSRANAVRDYEFWCKRADGWEKMNSERFENTLRLSNEERAITIVQNVTPLTIAPYSGLEAHIGAFTGIPAGTMAIRIEIEDLFGKRYSTQVLANDRKQ